MLTALLRLVGGLVRYCCRGGPISEGAQRQSKGVLAQRPTRSAAALVAWALVSALFASPCIGADRAGSGVPATRVQTAVAVKRVHLLFLEISAGKKIDAGDLSGLGPYAPIVEVIAKRMDAFRAQSVLLKRRISDAQLDEALSVSTFRSPSSIQAVEARIESLFQDLDQYRSAVNTFFARTRKDINHSDVSHRVKARFLAGFTSATRATRKVSLGQVEAMRKLAEHYINLLTFLDAITGRYRVQDGHIVFTNPNDLKVFRRDISLIRMDYVAMNYFHRKRLEITRNAEAKLKELTIDH